MSWFRDSRGLYCACFLAYQPDTGGGCPAHPCPEVPAPAPPTVQPHSRADIHNQEPNVMTERRWATEQEAAEHARVSGNTLRRWRAKGRITGYKVGRTVRYDLAEIDAALTRGGQVSADA